MDAGELRSGLESLHRDGFAWALACCRWDREEATEVLQTTYVKALEGSARFEGRSTLRTWLFSVIHRTAAERRRRGILRGLLLQSWRNGHAPPALVANPEAQLAASQTRERLRSALERLSARQREVLHLVFYQEMTVEEASSILGITVGSARTHYERGKRSLRRLLEETP